MGLHIGPPCSMVLSAVQKAEPEVGSRALSMNRDPLSNLSSIPFSNALHYLGIFNLRKQSPGGAQRLGRVLGNQLAELQFAKAFVSKMGPLPASGVSALLPLPLSQHCPAPSRRKASFPSSLIMTAVLCHRRPRARPKSRERLEKEQ